MTSLLSAISGAFAKGLVLGTFLPVTLFTVAFLWLVNPALPATIPTPVVLKTLEPQWQAFVATLLVLAFSGVLFNLNTSLLRLYQGYSWQDTWGGWLATWLVRRRWERLRRHRDRLRLLRRELKPLEATDPQARAMRKALQAPQTTLSNILNEAYPYEADVLLPTRLGNTIRNFEEYSKQLSNRNATRAATGALR